MRSILRVGVLLLVASVLVGWAPLRAEAAPSSAHVVVQSVRLTDNGDNDGFADPNETVSIYLTLHNGSGVARTGIGVALVSEDPDVDCVTAPVVAFGDLAAGESRESTVPLVFRL